MTNKIINKHIILTYIFVQVAFIFLAILLQFLIPLNTDTQEEIFGSVLNIAMSITLVTLFIYYNRNYFIDQFYDFKSNLFGNLGLIFMTFIILLFASGITNSIMEVINQNKTPDNQESINQMLNSVLFVKLSMVIYAILFAPIIEEFVFRKAILGLAPNKVVGILLSGFTFGLIHVIGDSIIQIIPYMIPGMILATIFYYSKRQIYVVILGHALYNSLILIALF